MCLRSETGLARGVNLQIERIRDMKQPELERIAKACQTESEFQYALAAVKLKSGKLDEAIDRQNRAAVWAARSRRCLWKLLAND